MSAEADRRTETIPEWKKEEVGELSELLESYDSVGVVGIAGIPSRQLQAMRRDLHGTAVLRVSRNTLLRRSLEEAGLGTLTEHVSEQVGLVATDENPFSLYQALEDSKTPAPIGAGEVAPNDIVIPAGDTGIDPGPFVGELQQIGADARIEEGSIQVLSDSTVLSAGEEVSKQLADVLNELEIEPKEVGLNLRALSADGVAFTPDDLDLDVDAYRADLEAGSARAWNLALNAEYPTAATAPSLLAAARADARSLGVHAAIEDEDLIPDLVGRADGTVRALAARIEDPDALPAALQDVEAPAAPAAEQEDDQHDDTDTPDGDDEPAASDEEDDDDDDDAGAEGLGAMFG